MARLIDKSKRSNVKCEHCKNWTGWQKSMCCLHMEEKQYYKRCKDFAWREDRKYIGERDDGDGNKNG